MKNKEKIEKEEIPFFFLDIKTMFDIFIEGGV